MFDVTDIVVVPACVPALPLSALTLVIVSLLTRKTDAAHLDLCFAPAEQGAAPATKD